jgi:hypothetical protein
MKYSEMTKKILDNYGEGKKPPFSLTNDRQIRDWLASAFGLNRVTPWAWKKHDRIPDAAAESLGTMFPEVFGQQEPEDKPE